MFLFFVAAVVYFCKTPEFVKPCWIGSATVTVLSLNTRTRGKGGECSLFRKLST